MAKIAFLIPLFPIFGFLINGLFGRRTSKPLAGYIACFAVLMSFVLGIFLFCGLCYDDSPRIFHFFEWIYVGDLKLNFAFHVDRLTLVMILAVTGVSGLIHIYSLGYMSQDRDYTRYFAHLNLFTSMMLILVMAENLPLMFIGWEGVGLCSYLLIGFWYEKQSAADAGRKAFIINRIGDTSFIIGMLLLYNHFGTLSIEPILQNAPVIFTYGSGILTAITILLFIGAVGKSAQFPLHVWLPDAMEGPTPVSALIHAATMVTAGVYMIARLNMLFLMCPATLWIIGIIATITAFGAATIAIAQYDIKRVLAYSTISQLGYMFVATSVGAFGAAIFHLITHAFFKALLFLAAGSVIHGLKNEMDMRKMGGLAKSMPFTWFVFLAGTFAISGFPFFAGFFSKDWIIKSAFVNPIYHKAILGIFGFLTALLTAFYSFRLYYRIFRGRYTGPEEIRPHDAPFIMAWPMFILTFLSAFTGFLAWPIANSFANFLDPVFGGSMNTISGYLGLESVHESSIPWGFWLISMVIFFVGWFMAFLFFIVAPEARTIWKKAYPRLWKSLGNKYYVDEVYNGGLVAPGKSLLKGIWLEIDLGLIDTIVDGLGYVCLSMGRGFSRMTTGYVRNYALYIVIGVIILIFLVLR